MDTQETEESSFLIQTEVTPNNLKDLLDFIYQTYILPSSSFKNVRRITIDGEEILTFTYVGLDDSRHVDIEITASNPVKIRVLSSETLTHTFLNKLRENLMITIQMFEEQMRERTIYFVWVPGVEDSSESSGRKRKIIHQIFTGNMLFFFILFLIFSYSAFLVLTVFLKMPILYFPIVFLVTQLVMMLFSHKIVEQMGDWPITKESPCVYILQFNLPPKEFDEFLNKFSKEKIMEMKRKIYERTFMLGKRLSVEAAKEVLNEFGIRIGSGNIRIKAVNIYGIVKEASRLFHIPAPKIMLSNTSIPNASASGVSPRSGLIVVTSGLLIRLDDEEILSVISHELSHIKRRDPIALFTLSSAEYLLRVYILWTLVYSFSLLYMLFALGLIYFIAKFFESRADLDSAIATRKPQTLADALMKIGYRRTRFERALPIRIINWLRWDPHPPISFRIRRLRRLRNIDEIKHPFLKSIKDCIDGFIESI